MLLPHWGSMIWWINLYSYSKRNKWIIYKVIVYFALYNRNKWILFKHSPVVCTLYFSIISQAMLAETFIFLVGPLSRDLKKMYCFFSFLVLFNFICHCPLLVVCRCLCSVFYMYHLFWSLSWYYLIWCITNAFNHDNIHL